MARGLPEDWVEVFASPRAADCRERALVLRAQGIPFDLGRSGGLHRVWVPEGTRVRAAAELESYERENRDWPALQEPPERRRGAAWGSASFALVVSLVWILSERGALGLDWEAAGAAHAQALRAGEAWRAVTSLTLHTGPVHLLGNLIFGSLFGLLVAWSHGSGVSWLAIVVAGALGNLTNAWVQEPTHLSVGASTAVFAAVGLLAGSEWRRRRLLRERRLRVAAPIVIGLLLLALHGVPVDPTGIDVLAHVLGLAWGLPIGAALPWLTGRLGEGRGVQSVAGGIAVGTVALAWVVALA